MKEKTSEWLNKATEDLNGARILLEHEEAPTNIIGFLCQQCLEKSFKGFLDENNVSFPRTHDLVYLVDLCSEIDPDFLEFKKEVNILLPFAVDARYPGFFLTGISKEKIQSLFQITERIFDFVYRRID